MIVEIKHIEDKRGNIIDKICNINTVACKNNGQICNCSVYSGNTELPIMFKY